MARSTTVRWLLGALAATALGAALPGAALAQDGSEILRRMERVSSADLFGGDYETMQDVDLDLCETACLADNKCAAFTFNEKSRWCFLKSEVGEERPVAGAVSGRVATGPATATATAAVSDEASLDRRDADLDFLPRTSRDAAKRLRLELTEATRDPAFDGLTLDQIAEGAGASLSQADAVAAWSEAAKREPLVHRAWMGLFEAALAYQPEEYEAQVENARLRDGAAINAYLTAASEPGRAAAMDAIGRSLEAQSSWKAAIKAYRASLAVADDADVRARLDAVVAEHGFRILEHTVDNNAANPRICVSFSDPLAPSILNSDNPGDYLSVQSGETLPVTASGSQLCVEGVRHGERYRVVARSGIASQDGETLARSADLDVYVRDRDPSVRFATNAYVLPAGGNATIPVTTVNTDEIKARVQFIGERGLASTLAEKLFLSRLYTYSVDSIAETRGEDVWKGSVGVRNAVNEEVTTAIPVAELVPDLKPGVYVLTATAENASPNASEPATQWFVVSDIGLASFSGADGFHVISRSLGTAEPIEDLELTLVAANNQILATATTDATGQAVIPAGLLRGTGGDRPVVLTAARNGADFNFLDLEAAPFDLTDRGVEGRAPVGALDVFLTPERGIYRTGETTHVTGLVRDAKGEAVHGLTLTGIVTRPDGVEFGRRQLADGGAGGFAWDTALPAGAQRGIWRFAVHTDPEEPAVAETSVRVEDFQPEKLDFTLSASSETFDPEAPPTISVDGRYLFGAPAANLDVQGEVVVSEAAGLDGLDGYRFGLSDDAVETIRQPFDTVKLDADGKAEVSLTAFAPPATTKPLQASLQVRVIDAGGRPVERDLQLALAGAAPRIGIKPRFEGAVDEGGEAGFDVVALDASGARVALSGTRWTLNRVTTDFQWYGANGDWNYEVVRRSERIADGTFDLPSDGAPAALTVPTQWGEYELRVEAASGDVVPASVDFESGWYVAARAIDTPEVASVSLDKPSYKIGETARVRVEPRFAAKVDVLVLDEGVVARQTADIPAEGGEVTFPVTREWGPGAYVLATAFRPMSIEEKRMPGRAIGLAYGSVDPAEKKLQVSIEAPAEIRPRQIVDATVRVAGLQPGDQAYLTLAAVDQGILNITDFQPPSLSEWYFGKRRLGVEIRDLYGKLIDRMQGAPGTVRSGGDASGSLDAPPPMDELVSIYSGVVTVGPDGTAAVPLPIPDFNGSLKLMALAWTKTAVGEANADMLVRDPVVVEVSRPIFLAPGDSTRIAVDLTHVDGPTGEAVLSLTGGEGVVSLSGGMQYPVDVSEKARARVLVPVLASRVGDAEMRLSVSLPGGERLEKTFTLPVRSNAPEQVEKSIVQLAPNGGRLSLDPAILADFQPGTGSVTVSVTGAAQFDVAGVVRALDRYPYGCTEQLVSRAMPLVYLDRTVVAAGLGQEGVDDVKERVQKAVTAVLANQSSNGSFGLWEPGYGDLWLDAYVTDFLTRAREAGYQVPEEGFTLAVDNLRNSLAYVSDAPDWPAVAYSYYVLARNGRAAIGDLRYYSENELSNFPTPLAKAQLAAALAFYGDRVRAERVLSDAVRDAEAPGAGPETRSDYGTKLRDEAGVLAVGLESGVDGVSLNGLVDAVNAGRRDARYTSTQEDAWSLLAAHALLDRDPPALTVAGRDVNGAWSGAFDEASLRAGPEVSNRDDAPESAAVTVRGVPTVAGPAETSGYSIERRYYTLEGEEADPAAIAQGDRLVAVLEVVPIDNGPAKLVVDDPLPAGFSIDNPAILRGGDVSSLDWLELSSEVAHVEFRADRFVAAFDKDKDDTAIRRFAYIVRAVSAGEFVHPAALVENMYDPSRRGTTAQGRVTVVDGAR